MDLTLLLIILVVLIAAGGILVVFMTVGGSGNKNEVRQQAAVSDSLRSLVRAQRQGPEGGAPQKGAKSLALAAAAESEETRRVGAGSAYTLERRLQYAQWKITPLQFRAIQFAVTLAVFIPVFFTFHWTVWVMVLFITPNLVKAVLDRAVNKRFKAFDKDYPVLLMQYVSMLKTGMSTIPGLDAAAKGLETDSIVRAEVELLVERLRIGLTEEQAINAFGEDIFHPELELFVQSLILSKRVGGNLSQTLERLAKQVRKRQQFREEAISAVGMEQNSIYAIMMIMTCLLCYIAFMQPELIIPALSHPTGTKIIQGGIALIAIGFYWSRKVTNIRV